MKHKITAALLTATLTVACAGALLTACGGKDLSKAEIELSQTEYVYDGTARMPDVTVTYGKEEIALSELYVEYSNNVNVGTATVTVTPATSAYKGSKTAEFTILPAETSVAQEVVLTAYYNQTIGDVIGDYNIAETDKGYTLATVLTEIGEKTYTFRSLYTPADPNYQSVYQTVYITVTKADPDAAGELAKSYNAFVGDSYSALSALLPAGAEVATPDAVFEETGSVPVNVVVRQTVNGTADEEHYNVLNKTVTVNVQPKEFEVNGNSYIYHNTAFAESDMTVNGNAKLESAFESCGNWTVSVSFTGTVESFDLHMMFDNVTDSKVADTNKQNLFEFGETNTLTSWLGSLVSNRENNKTDTVSLPDHSGWQGFKITVVSTLKTSEISRREYQIYFGDSADEELGELMFTRWTDRKHQYRFQYIFTGAENVQITDLSFTESAYVHDKLINTKFAQYLVEGTSTVRDEFKNGGLLMIGDSLVDYWGQDFGTATALSAAASRESFGQYGYSESVVNVGIGGSTAEDWLNYFEAASDYFGQLNPEVVFMLIGCNQISFEDGKNISETVIRLIETVAEAYPNAHIVVNSLMPTTTANSRWANWYRLDNANKVIAQYIENAKNDNLIYLDVHTMFAPDPSKPISSANAPVASWHAADGLHYQKTAYDLWAQKILERLEAEGIVTITELALTVKDADYGIDLTQFVTVKYSMCNGRLVVSLELNNQYAVESILLNREDVTSYYDAEKGTLVYVTEELFQTGTLEIRLVVADNPDDNVSDDDDFKNSFAGNFADAEITLSQTVFIYDGTEKEPTVTVMLDGATVDPATYAVSYRNNVNAGTATVIVSAIDGTGYAERTLTFTITITVEVQFTDKNGNGDLSQYAEADYEVRDGKVFVTISVKPLPNQDSTVVSAVFVNGTDATANYNAETGTFEYNVSDCGNRAEITFALDYEADPNDNPVDDEDFQTP